jgi:hypothetical protein
MTIRAANIALLDFYRHNRPRLPNHQQANVLTFGRAVTAIELQGDDVGLSTIDTRMRTQVCAEKTPVLRSAAANSVNLACDVFGPGPEVMGLPISRMTCAAMGLSVASAVLRKANAESG